MLEVSESVRVESTMGWKVGIDTGGTFTDVAAVNTDTRELLFAKVPSDPRDPGSAVMACLDKLLATHKLPSAEGISFFAHGTTVATNALLEMKGAQPGLLLTSGYRGIYEIRGGSRPTGSDLIDTFYRKPPLLVSQAYTEEIVERIASDGSILVPLNEDSVRKAIRRLRDRGADSISICYLFSFVNPVHELRTAEIIKEEFPACRMSLSSSVLPVIREYRRCATTLLDAYVGPVVEAYLRRLGDRLHEARIGTEQLYVMQSNGGLMRVDVAANYPNQTLLSGPAAGVVFASSIGNLIGERNLVTLDMGGTSTDISTIVNGDYVETREGSINGQDIGTPMIEIQTFAAGGGTIAWIGPDGLLKVGPHSAGAYPGPACFGNGGTNATVTDANVVLGYLGSASLIGGQFRINQQLASDVIVKHVADQFSLDVEEAALGVIRVVNLNIEVGLRLALVEKGLDPRKFVLVAFGGCGPMHAGRVARNVGIPRVIVPPMPGISCAMGLLQTDVRHLYMQSRFAPLITCALDEINDVIGSLEEKACADAIHEGFDPSLVELICQLDLRYPKQGYELPIPCPRIVTEADRAAIRAAFDRTHEQVFGVSAPDEAPEIINVRITSVVRIPKFEFEIGKPAQSSAEIARVGERPAYFEETGRYVAVPVYRRQMLSHAHRIDGPAIIEQFDATTVIYPGQSAEVDPIGNIIILVGRSETMD